MAAATTANEGGGSLFDSLSQSFDEVIAAAQIDLNIPEKAYTVNQIDSCQCM
jgi:hypothetical protein